MSGKRMILGIGVFLSCMLLGGLLTVFWLVGLSEHLSGKKSLTSWRPLIRYEDGYYYQTGKSSFARKADKELNAYTIVMEDQSVRPQMLEISFSDSRAHTVFAIDNSNRLLFSKVLGTGRHEIEISDQISAVAMNVYDGEEEMLDLTVWGNRKIAQTAYTGKTFSVMGDSLSAYYRYIPENNRNYYDKTYFNVQSMWWNVMAEQTGMSPCVINASGGSGVTELDQEPLPDHPLAGNSKRSGELGMPGQDPDVIFILLGANDYIHGVSIEEIRKNYLEMVQKIQGYYPKSEIKLCTYFPFLILTMEQTQELNDIIREIAEKMKLDVLETSECGICIEEPWLYFADLNSTGMRGVHPNEAGQELLGLCVANELLGGSENREP